MSLEQAVLDAAEAAVPRGRGMPHAKFQAQKRNRNSMGQFLRSLERYRFVSHGLKPVNVMVGVPGREVPVQIGWEFDQPKGVTRFTNKEAFERLGSNGRGALDVYD